MIEARVTDEALPPIRLTLTSAAPAHSLLRIKAHDLRRTVLGVYEVTDVRMDGGEESFPFADRLSFEEVQADWMAVLATSSVAVVEVPAELPAGAVIEVRTRRYPQAGVSQRKFAWRTCKVELGMVDEPRSADFESVSEPAEIRFTAGPAERIEAWLKPDGRLDVQHFDRYDNPADSGGAALTVNVGGEEIEANARRTPPPRTGYCCRRRFSWLRFYRLAPLLQRPGAHRGPQPAAIPPCARLTRRRNHVL